VVDVVVGDVDFDGHADTLVADTDYSGDFETVVYDDSTDYADTDGGDAI
jgi:hypothetical protein